MINQIKEDMKQAMRDKDKVKLSTLRMLLATIDNERIKLKVEELNDEQVITCINRNLKQLGQEIDSLMDAFRNIDNQLEQQKVLKSYLPEQLGLHELTFIVQNAVAHVKAEGDNFGMLMKELSSLKGRADMKKVSKLAKELF